MGKNTTLGGLLIVLSGPSGVGKGSVCKELYKINENIKESVSVTTRKPREGEKDGVSYYFTDQEGFFNMIEKGELLEWAKVYDNYYGTPIKAVLDNLKAGRDVLLELDIQGAMKVQQNFPEGVFIFLLPPSISELKNRISKRGTETEEDLDKRFNAAKEEIQLAREYNYVIVNNILKTSADRIDSIVKAEKCRVKRYGEELIREVIEK